jgi:phosphoglycerate dehydrogenase-like enzyme
MRPIKLLVIARPNAPYLSAVDQLAPEANIVKGNSFEEVEAEAADADVILNDINAGDVLRRIFPLAKKVQWVHSLSAGVENTLSPELLESPVPLTNARGVFKDSLAEWAIAAALFFAKDLRRLVRSQEQHRWDPFDIDMLGEQTLGIIGYGEIGRATAVRAHALGMRILAVRRRPELSKDDPIVSKSFGPEQRVEMLSECDYIVLATPRTSGTNKLIGAAELNAMKSNAVVINVGRGNAIDEGALAEALRQKRIRGAALDVFAEEPLPADHPFWSLDNLLLSPHSADHTADWLHRATRLFLTNFRRFAGGEPLLNVVDKRAGY